MTGSAIHGREFTFATFHGLTTGLLGHERARVFHQLQPKLQEQALRELHDRTEKLSRLLFEEQCR